ncbi:MAG: zinc ribbon domain-containing protein [Caldilineaceae bacterium]|nr:zinc ribbon domain-containing protein [Caldilineaceae bacterium]
MPLYEFTCTHCSEHFEQILSFSMTEVPACPHCRSTATRRLMSMPAIHFKGSGFYKTDNANGKDKAEEKADTDVKADAKDADTQGGKADTKGDASDSGPRETATPPKAAKTDDKARQGKAKAKAAAG